MSTVALRWLRSSLVACVIAAAAGVSFAGPEDDAHQTCRLTSDPAVALAQCKALAEKGNAFAALDVAKTLLDGPPPNDTVEGVKWMRRAAEGGSPEGQWRFGGLLEWGGSGVIRNPIEAATWYRRAADQGHVPSQILLGTMYLEGRGVALDKSEALKWYKLAAETFPGSSAPDRYAALYQELNGAPPPPLKLPDEVLAMIKAAEMGDVAKQLQLGRIFASGQAVSKDNVEAAKWYRKAADQGDAEAQHRLGYVYENGLGVGRDLSEAVKWYRTAAEHGDVEANSILARMYKNGQGVEKSDAEAMNWYRRGAEKGDLYAQRTLGDAYAEGVGVPQSYAEAAKWYRLAADQGSPDALVKLAEQYKAGQGVPKDPAEAKKLYQRAADQGDTVANYELKTLIASAPPPPSTPVTPQDHLASAEALLGRQNYSAAIDALLAALNPIPGSGPVLEGDVKARALSDLGYAYNASGSYLLAGSTLTKALELQPEFFAALVNRAITRGAMGSYDLAQQDLLHAQRLASGDETATVSQMLGQLADMRKQAAVDQASIAAPRSSASTASNTGPTDYLGDYLKNQEQVNRNNCARAAAGANVGCSQ